MAGASPNNLNGHKYSEKELKFVLDYVASEDPIPAKSALAAGYSKNNPGVVASKLLSKPKIQALLAKYRREREKRTQVTSDMIWEKLHRVLEYNPLSLFEAGPSGWYVTDIEQIPPEVGKLIEEVEVHEDVDDDGEVYRRRLRVKIMSKSQALQLAAKHALPPPVQRHQVAVAAIPWDQLCTPPDEMDGDVIEARITQLEEGSDERKERRRSSLSH